MPVNQTLMDALKKKYGPKKGESVYYGMEEEGKTATKPPAVEKSRRHREMGVQDRARHYGM